MQGTKIVFFFALFGCLPVYSDTATDTSPESSSGTSGESTSMILDPTSSGDVSTSSTSGTSEGSSTSSAGGSTGGSTGTSTGEADPLPGPGEPFGPCKNPGGRLFCNEEVFPPVFCIPVGDMGHVCAPGCLDSVCVPLAPETPCECLPSGVGIIPCVNSEDCPFDGMQCMDAICAYPD